MFFNEKKKKKTFFVTSSSSSLKTLGFKDANAALPPLQNIYAKRYVSSPMYCSRESCHLKYVGVEKVIHLQYVVALGGRRGATPPLSLQENNNGAASPQSL